METPLQPMKIISPKTNRKITVGKGEYNKLLQDGYTIDELLIPVNNQDIFYNIMLNSDIKDINSLCRTNNLANQLCNSNYFWKDKFNIDYEFVTPKSTMWKQEYIDIYNSNKMAKTFIKVIKLMLNKTKSYSAGFYIANSDGMPISINELMWLPPRIINQFTLLQFRDSETSFIINTTDKQITRYLVTIIVLAMDYSRHNYKYEMNEEEFIIFLTLLFYYNPEYHIKHEQGYELLYKDLVNNATWKQEKEMQKYWNKILKQNK